MGYCGKYAQKWTHTLIMLSTPQEWICRHRKCLCKLFNTHFDTNSIELTKTVISMSHHEAIVHLTKKGWGCYIKTHSASDQERLRRLHQDPVKIPVRLRWGNQDPVEVLGQSRPSQATRASVKKHLMACVKWVCPAGCPWGRTAVVLISSEVWHDMFIFRSVRRTIVHVPMQW